jgi:hypothetical protein
MVCGHGLRAEELPVADRFGVPACVDDEERSATRRWRAPFLIRTLRVVRVPLDITGLAIRGTICSLARILARKKLA